MPFLVLYNPTCVLLQRLDRFPSVKVVRPRKILRASVRYVRKRRHRASPLEALSANNQIVARRVGAPTQELPLTWTAVLPREP